MMMMMIRGIYERPNFIMGSRNRKHAYAFRNIMMMMMMIIIIIIRGKDGGTKFIMRINEHVTRLILQEYDDDNDDDPRKRWMDQLFLEDQGRVNTPISSGI